jgi:hypothetical protein
LHLTRHGVRGVGRKRPSRIAPDYAGIAIQGGFSLSTTR